MKLANFVLAFSLVGALSAVGCGSSQNDNPPPVNAIVNAGTAAVPIPAPGVGATVPVGQYANGAACPTGYMQTGAYCTQNTNGATNCGTGWNGYTCGQPSGLGCPTGTNFSYQYGGCISMTGYPSGYGYGNNNNYYCGTVQMGWTLGYVCYYTNGAPMSGYYYNGYGWVRFN